MKRIVKLGALLLFFIILCSCRMSVRHNYLNIESRYLADNKIPNLYVTHPVAIKNISTAIKEKRLCGSVGPDDYWGKLYDFTESTVSIAKDALQRKNITIDDKAEKILELKVNNATCESGWKLSASTSLIVRTGNGLEKEYKGSDTYHFAAQTGHIYEVTLAQCVEQMLNDKDIIDYLQN